jgi:hypothetical protein
MIRAYLDDQQHSKWAKQIPFLQLAINTSKQESTGFSPAAILFNRDFISPFDLSIGLNADELKILKKVVPKSYHDIIFDRHNQYIKILSLVSQNLTRAKEKQKKYYDLRHRDDHFSIGDPVVIKDTTLSDKDKGITAGLCPLYRRAVGVIHQIVGDLNYMVKFGDGSIKGPLHIQFLRRYRHREQQQPSTQSQHSQDDNNNNVTPAASATTSSSSNEINNDMNDNAIYINNNDHNDSNNHHDSLPLDLNNLSNFSNNLPSNSNSNNSISNDQPVGSVSDFDTVIEPSAPIFDNFSDRQGDTIITDTNVSVSSQPPPRKSHRLTKKPRVDYNLLAGNRRNRA